MDIDDQGISVDGSLSLTDGSVGLAERESRPERSEELARVIHPAGPDCAFTPQRLA